jgi:hypothetical protein
MLQSIKVEIKPDVIIAAVKKMSIKETSAMLPFVRLYAIGRLS